jgi:hypothetical protein
MPDLAALLQRYHTGERLDFGPEVALHQGVLYLPGHGLSLNSLEPLHLQPGDRALVRLIGSEEPPLVLLAAGVDDLDQFVQLANHLIAAIPPLERRSITGWPPGSIGDVSARIGYDVRDLILAGYSEDQIQGLLDRQYALDELLAQRPGRAAEP